jgi:sugar phosphate isomerase/epimerase
MSKFKISVSLTDFPLFRSWGYLFRNLKDSGIDGIELVPGVKSRLQLDNIKHTADKYGIPILSVHQPPWSVLGIAFDTSVIVQVRNLGIKHITFHPPFRSAFSDTGMNLFLQRLAYIKKRYQMTVQLENMPKKVRMPVLKDILKYHSDTKDPVKVYKAVKKYSLYMTFDTSHAISKQPHKEEWFSTIYPAISNIHLSSFTAQKDHLPLHMGDFDTKSFIRSLKRNHYEGLITLEIHYPKMISYRTYDFENIKKSVDIIKNA